MIVGVPGLEPGRTVNKTAALTIILYPQGQAATAQAAARDMLVKGERNVMREEPPFGLEPKVCRLQGGCFTN
jgi:hypothetical protein